MRYNDTGHPRNTREEAMSEVQGRRIRWRPSWKPSRYVVLKNVSERNILLHLPTGHQRIEKGRRLLVTPEIAHLPEIQEYVRQGILVVEDDHQQ